MEVDAAEVVDGEPFYFAGCGAETDNGVLGVRFQGHAVVD